MFYQKTYESCLGRLFLVSSETSLVGLWLEGQKYQYGTLRVRPEENDHIPVLQQAGKWLNRYFAGERPDSAELPLAPKGTAFQREVWDILRIIPYGQVMTYGEVAAKIASRRGVPHMSPQAVGNAVGHNPISIIVPCHRVIGAKGSLTGYAGGLEKKMWLLRHEGAWQDSFFIPKQRTAP